MLRASNMGDLAHVFHVRPWEIALLSPADFFGLCHDLDYARKKAASTEG